MYRWVRQHYQFQLRGRRFLEAPWSGGLVLLFSVAVAMLLANAFISGTSLQWAQFFALPHLHGGQTVLY